VTRLLLVRHGETLWNHEGRLQGQTDVELSPFGREQAMRLRDRLTIEHLATAYSSDLRRCWDTASIALDGRDVPLQAEPALREIHLGAWQGRTWEELRREDPAQRAYVEADTAHRAPPGGETRGDVQRRIVASVLGIAARHTEATVLVVSHGGALRALLCWALAADLLASRRIELDNCGLSILHLRRDAPLLQLWNDASHLDGLVDPLSRSAVIE
jgi:alpha-ribazole phosphatase